ncbi:MULTISPECIES: IS1595 family transposase [Glutamicibacter]|uniref:IS1595 family transposase n=1 Tax=Glutamicibacter TaxID=1742989 RepID=UPI00167FD239|nr:IS1595 family transposase [Glutamicibacter nicotianae]
MAQPIAGRDYPVDLAQLRAWFPTDEACLDYLDWLRWPEGFMCPHCGAVKVGREASGRYRCHGCRKQVSVTSGTIFHKTRIPLTVWFEAVWLVTSGKTGVSSTLLHRVLPISTYQTAWTMLAKLRSVMGTAESEPLSGRVEIDETFIGGHRTGVGGRGSAGKTLVAGAIEVTDHGWGRARLAVIPDASAASLGAFARTNVAAGATIATDGWRSYPSALKGYVHEPFNVSTSGRPAHESLPAVHRLFAQVKRMLDGTYQGGGSSDHLQEYLDEFVFRFNRRHSRHRGLVFMRLLQRAVDGQPVTFRSLVRTPVPKAVRPTGVTGPRSQPGTLDVEPEDHPWRNNPHNPSAPVPGQDLGI